VEDVAAGESPKQLDQAGEPRMKWYAEVTRYQWLVLAIASAGWAFDAMEGQIYNVTRDAMLREILPGDVGAQKFWSDALLATFLLGGTLGGVVFGNLADRFGRKPAMALSILFYSVFSGLTFFATQIWHVAVLRFFVALGVGGEWAVAAALVAEVFPPRARARAGGIFHGTSVAGVWLAAAAGLMVGSNWRYAYLIGVIPALLVLWVRARIKEPERWQHAAAARAGAASEGGASDAVAVAATAPTDTGAVAPLEPAQKLGSFRDLFGNWTWATRAIFGVLLAAVGLATFWGVVVAGQDLARELLVRTGVASDVAAQKAKIAYGYVQVMGMLVCFLAFGPIAERIGRRATFLILHLGAVAIVPITCYLPQTYWQLLLILPIFGFFTGGMHAGYAIYFPELFPDRLRATGTGLCFNGGRLIAAPLLFLSGSIKSSMDLRLAITMLAGLYVLGAVMLLFLPETKGKPLPE
jgi:MFS family permease